MTDYLLNIPEVFKNIDKLDVSLALREAILSGQFAIMNRLLLIEGADRVAIRNNELLKLVIVICNADWREKDFLLIEERSKLGINLQNVQCMLFLLLKIYKKNNIEFPIDHEPEPYRDFDPSAYDAFLRFVTSPPPIREFYLPKYGSLEHFFTSFYNEYESASKELFGHLMIPGLVSIIDEYRGGFVELERHLGDEFSKFSTQDIPLASTACRNILHSFEKSKADAEIKAVSETMLTMAETSSSARPSNA